MVIAEIVSQHAEEAAFLWLLRSNATRAPHYALKDIGGNKRGHSTLFY